MSKTFAVLGAGMQGTAAAYDLALFGGDVRIIAADVDLGQAQRCAHRVEQLTGHKVEPKVLDASDPVAMRQMFQGVDVVLSCLPYYFHTSVARACIESKASMLDLGGNMDITRGTLELNDAAVSAGVSIVPDCGLAPGMVNNLGAYLISQFDKPESVKLFCGVLPQNPKPPLNYMLLFNVEGLTNEYDHTSVVIRNGKIAEIGTLSEDEEQTFDQLGTLEASVTSGGTSTAPYTFLGRVSSYEYKTLRFPGHWDKIRLFRDLGFWKEDAVDVQGGKVVPRAVFNKVLESALLSQDADADQCLVRAIGTGEKGGKPTLIQLDLYDKQDPKTGLTAMERLTGFSMSIYALEIAAGNVLPGAIRYELAVEGQVMIDRLEQRGIRVRKSES